MSTTYPSPPPGLEFPDSDGQPMAENTRQWEAIATLKGNVEAVAPADAFVAGDHLIYVDPTDPTDRQAPDVYVAFGRPRGHRGSYMLWEEGGVFPQVVFEVLGPSNTAKEMRDKQKWYFGHGAEEYYEFDPEAGTWLGVVLDPATGDPEPVAEMDGYASPRLGIRFAFRPMELVVLRPDGTPFLSFAEMEERAEAERARAAALAERIDSQAEQIGAQAVRLDAQAVRIDAQAVRLDDLSKRVAAQAEQVIAERARADAEKAEGEVHRLRALLVQSEADRLRALLRAAGLDPDAAPPPPG